MPLHLIIEGSDKVGKTTVCKILSEMLEVPVIKMVDMPKYFSNGLQEEASEVFNKAIVQFAHTSFIMDRGYPSSIVYSDFFKRKYDLTYLDDIIRKLDARIYVLNVSPRENDDIIKRKDQGVLRLLYNHHADKNGWKIINCTDLKPEQIAEEIIKDINQWTKQKSSSSVVESPASSGTSTILSTK